MINLNHFRQIYQAPDIKNAKYSGKDLLRLEEPLKIEFNEIRGEGVALVKAKHLLPKEASLIQKFFWKIINILMTKLEGRNEIDKVGILFKSNDCYTFIDLETINPDNYKGEVGIDPLKQSLDEIFQNIITYENKPLVFYKDMG